MPGHLSIRPLLWETTVYQTMLFNIQHTSSNLSLSWIVCDCLQGGCLQLSPRRLFATVFKAGHNRRFGAVFISGYLQLSSRPSTAPVFITSYLQLWSSESTAPIFDNLLPFSRQTDCSSKGQGFEQVLLQFKFLSSTPNAVLYYNKIYIYLQVCLVITKKISYTKSIQTPHKQVVIVSGVRNNAFLTASPNLNNLNR